MIINGTKIDLVITIYPPQFHIQQFDFDFNKIAKYNKSKINSLLRNEGIIRNKLKIESAITNAYAAADKISWPHKYCRKDIGKKGLSYL